MRRLWEWLLAVVHGQRAAPLVPREPSAPSAPLPVPDVPITLVPPPPSATSPQLPAYEPQATRIAFSTPPVALFAVGLTGVVRAVVLDQADLPLVDQPAVDYASSAPSTAAVTNAGVVTAIALGGANIVATVPSLPDLEPAALPVWVGPRQVAAEVDLAGPGGGSGDVTLVLSIPPASISLSPPSASVPVGSTVQLSAVVRDAQGNPIANATVSWQSDAPGIASVTQAGLVTARAQGTARITAVSRTVSGTVTSGPVTITVTAAAIPSAPTLTSIAPATAAQGASAVSVDVDGTGITADTTLVFSDPKVTVADVTPNPNGAALTGHITVAADATVGAGTVKLHSPTAGDSGTLPFSVTASGGGGGTLGAVTDLAAVVNADRTVTLTWTDVPGAAGYTVQEDGTQIGTVAEGPQVFTTGVGGGAPPVPMKIDATAMATVAGSVGTPPFAAYAALNVPAIPVGGSYLDPQTNRRVYKLWKSDGTGGYAYFDYGGGGHGWTNSLPLDAKPDVTYTDPVLGTTVTVEGCTRRYLYWLAGANQWRMFDAFVNADGVTATVTNDRLLAIQPGGEVCSVFSPLASEPHILYILATHGDAGQATIQRLDTTTNAEAPTAGFPAGGKSFSWSTTSGASWLTCDDAAQQWGFCGESAGPVQLYNSRTGVQSVWDGATGMDAADQPQNEGRISPDGVYYVAAGASSSSPSYYYKIADGTITKAYFSNVIGDGTNQYARVGHHGVADENAIPLYDTYWDEPRGTYVFSEQHFYGVKPSYWDPDFIRWEYVQSSFRQPNVPRASRYYLANDDEMLKVLPASGAAFVWTATGTNNVYSAPCSFPGYAVPGRPIVAILGANVGVKTMAAAGGVATGLETFIGALPYAADLATMNALGAGVGGCFADGGTSLLYVRMPDGSDPTGKIPMAIRQNGIGQQAIAFMSFDGTDQRVLCGAYTVPPYGGENGDPYYMRPRVGQSKDGKVVRFGSTMLCYGGRNDLFITFPPLVTA